MNPTCLVVLAIFFLVIFYYVSKYLKKKPQNLMLYLVLLALAAFTFYKWAEVKQFVRTCCFGQKPPKTIYYYDTDPANNAFIKENLNEKQLALLDLLLMEEKETCGLKLSNLRIQELSRNDQFVQDAYERWRKCRNMNRSYHRVVYPDEREVMKGKRR